MMTGFTIYRGNVEQTKTVEEWKQYIQKGRNKVSRPCANNTTVRLENENIVFKLHETDIVTLNADGTAILDSGGWHTVTTKERINRYTNARIHQTKGVWYMSDGSLFYDGIVLDESGQPLESKESSNYENKLKIIKKQARKYAKDYVQALKDGLVPYPSSGDCWYCLGMLEGSEHFLSHIEENYFVPTLLINAGRDAGYTDMQVGLMGIGGEQGQRLFINPENNIYKYIVKQLQKSLDAKVAA